MVQLGFIDATDLSEDDLIVSSSDEEKIVDDVTLSERKSYNDEQMSSSEDEALINFANHGYGKKKVKKPVQPSWNLKYNLKYKQDDFLFKVSYEKEIDKLLDDLGTELSYFLLLFPKELFRNCPTIIIAMNPIRSDFWDTLHTKKLLLNIPRKHLEDNF